MKDFKIPGLSNDKTANTFAQPAPPNQQYQAQPPEKETLKERGKNWMATMTGAMSGAIPPLQITGRHKRQGSVSSIMSVRSMMGGRTKDRGVLPDFGAGSKAEEPTVEGAIRLLQYATNALRKKSLKSSEIFSRIQQAKESSDMAKAYNDILSHGQSLTEKHIRKLSPPTIIYVIKAYLTHIRPLISPECYKLMTETIETQGDDSAIGESCSSTFRELIEKYTPESKRRLLAKFIHFLTDLHTKIEGGSFNTGTFGIEFRDSIFEPIYPNQSSFDADQMQEATMSIHFDRTIFQVLMENYADIFIEGGNVDVDPSDGRSSVAGSSVNQSLRQQGSSTNLSIESGAPSTLLEMRKEEEKLLRRGSTIGKWKGKLTLNRSRGASQKLAQKIESVHSDAEEYLSKLDQYLDEMKSAVMNSLDPNSMNAQSDSAYASNDQIASDPSPETLNADIFCHSVGTHKQYLKDHINNLRADFELLREMLAEEKFNLLEENKKLKLENANLKSDYDQVILERDDLDKKLQNLEQFIKSKSLAQDQIKQENDASAKTKSEIRRSQSDIPRFQNRGFKGIAFADKWRGLRESEVDLPGSSSTTLYTTDHGRVTLTEDHPLSS
ncbi:hypothetical protein BKA69DRAFT_764042 [Paraphysoderma sedebokerense]|nr:hypothetical protein BKA69DRAFT_764042 [Paraphysoderma sedebokerense]